MVTNMLVQMQVHA